MLDLILLATGPAFLLGSIALAAWTDWREDRASPPPPAPGRRDGARAGPPALRLVR